MKKLKILFLVLSVCLVTGCSSGKNGAEGQTSGENISEDGNSDVAEGQNGTEAQGSEEQSSTGEGESEETGGSEDEKTNREPEEGELFDGIAEMFKDFDACLDMNMQLSLAAEMDTGFRDVKMSLKMDGDINLESKAECQHTFGSMDMELSGMASKHEKDIYHEKKGDMIRVYKYDETKKKWSAYYTDEDKSVSGCMVKLGQERLEESKMESDGDGYVVTGTGAYEDIADIIMNMMDGMENFKSNFGLVEEDLQKCHFDTVMVFDKESWKLTKMTYVVKSADLNGTGISDFKVEFVWAQDGKVSDVTVPEEVRAAWYKDNKEPLSIKSTGKHDAAAFIKELSPLADVKETDWFIYNSQKYGYTTAACDYDSNDWRLYFEFSVFEDAEDAEDEYLGNEYYKAYLEENEADGNPVYGHSKGNCVLWYVKGGRYNMYYMAKEGNTVLKVYGRVSSSSESEAERQFKEMADRLGEIADQLGLPQ